MNQRPVDLAWAAGFLDGEGSVRIRRTWSASTARKVYSVALCASQVDREPLDRLVALFGGTVNPKQQVRARRENSMPYWSWMTTGARAVEALKGMLPYLTVKRDRAKLAIEFQRLTGPKRSGMRRLTDQEMASRHAYHEQMRVLNLRGGDRRAAAETKSRGRGTAIPVCDSPVCTDDKRAEAGGNVQPLRRVV